MFIVIACIGQNRELGYRGDLCFHLSADLKFFKTTTSGHPLVMGRKTWDSLPKKLPERQNIVISRHPDLIAPKHPIPTQKPLETPKNSLKPQNDLKNTPKNPTSTPEDLSLAPDETITNLENFISDHQNDPETYFIIGGAEIYQAFLPVSKTLFLTEIAASVPADTYFPDFDRSLYQRKILQKGTENGLKYTISSYTKS